MGFDLGAAPPPEIKLRNYQDAALEKLRGGLRSGLRRQMLCSPTGSGKTICAAALMNEARKKGSRVAFIVDRIALVDQTSRVLSGYGIPHGVAQGQNRSGYHTRIHVLSSQTIERNLDNVNKLSDYDLLIIDEAHIVRRKVADKMVEADVPVIGLSATPFTKGLGDIYQRIINVRSTDQLTNDGWLVPLKIFVGTPIDMSGAKTQAGEWTSSVVDERVLPIVGDVVADWQKHVNRVFGGTVPTILFSSSVAAGRDFCAQFNEIGVRAAQVSYRDKDDDERRQKIEAFRNGQLDLLCSVDALGRGFDVPGVKCVILARPFRRSLASVVQQIGRGQRIDDDKDSCLILDNARNVIRFADRIEDFWANGLNTLHSAKLEELRKPGDEKKAAERECSECGYVMPKGAEMCPSCGATRPSAKDNEGMVHGEMQEYHRGQPRKGTFDWDIWPDCAAYAVHRWPDDDDRARRLALAQHKNIVGKFPSRGRTIDEAAESCHPDVAATIKRNIASWAIRRKYANAR